MKKAISKIRNNSYLKKIKELESKNVLLDASYSQLKELEEKLKNSEKKYRQLFELSSDAIFLMDKDKFIDCNRKTLKIFGCDKKEDIVGHSPFEYSPPKQADGQSSKTKALKYIKAAFDGKTQEFDWLHSKKSGEIFQAQVSLKKFITNGKSFLQAIVRDVTESKQAEEKLKESEFKFKTILTNAQAVIFMIDKEGEFLLSEGKGLKDLGLKPGEAVGQSAFELYKDNESVVKAIKSALDGNYTEVVSCVGGIYYSTFYSPYKDEKGKVIGLIGMAIDVTEREEATFKFKELDRIKTEFMATASHQLRSPLGSIRWGLENIRSNEAIAGHPDCQLKLDEVYNSTLRVIDLVNDLLSISRIEQKKTQLMLEKFDIREIFKTIITELELEIKKKKIDLSFIKPSGELSVSLDKKLTREVIQNLISNAIKYNDPGGKILLIVRKENGKVLIDIANTGLLIPEKDRDRIFEKFFRSEKALKSDVGGSGLGLFVTKSYVEQWGGKISFKSPKKFGDKSLEGEKFKGTLFSIELPLSIDDEPKIETKK